jgi:hypothetical protein
MDIKARIEAATKMLFASGRQLDIEAAKLIEELNAERRSLLGYPDLASVRLMEVLGLEGENAYSLNKLAALAVDAIQAGRNKIADLYIERDIEMSRADGLQAKLDAVGPMRYDKACERRDEMMALMEENNSLRAENMMLRDAVRKHKVPVTVVPRPLMEDEASVRGAFVELAEVSEKLAKALGREPREEDTPLLLADEVDREMMVLKVQFKIAQRIGEQALKTHQDYCAAHHTWKPLVESWGCMDRIFSEDDGEPNGLPTEEEKRLAAEQGHPEPRGVMNGHFLY